MRENRKGGRGGETGKGGKRDKGGDRRKGRRGTGKGQRVEG